MIKKGDIYLVDFGKSRDSFSFGKKRPVIVFQTDKLNYAIKEKIYNHVLVIPLSTKNDPLTDEFRLQILKRENLKQNSYAVCNSICFLDIKHLKQKLTTLTEKELSSIEKILINTFDITI
jgi:mRNA-degrading endonuclease toxin of MazEF toxin-antitoxin module